MGSTKSAPWFVAATLASVVILALSWFFAISPAMTVAAEARSQAAQESDLNDLLQLQIATLADQFAHLDEYKADLAALRVQVPAEADLSELNRELQALATSTGVTLTAVQQSVPAAFVPAVAVPAAVAPTTTDGGTTEAAGTDAPAGAVAAADPAPAAVAPVGFYAVPVSVTLVGSYEQASAFLSSFQTGSQRLFLAASITALAQEETGATNGRPALAAGDLELTVTGFAYVLQGSAAAVPEAPAEETAPPALPEPSDQRNPFQPIAS